jgi:hypothetical protein
MWWVLVGLVVVGFGVVVSAAAFRPAHRVGGPGATAGPASAPTQPPARVCDSVSLRGPSAPPPHSVVVRPRDNLDDLSDAHPPGTTFWLAPGAHHPGDGPYSQIHPKSGDRYVGAPGAVIDGRHINQYAFGGQASDVRITYLTIQSFGQPGDNFNEGVVNHDFGSGWVLSHLTIQNDAGAGALLGTGNVLESSCVRDNGQSGFNAYNPAGVHNLRVDHNEITGNNTDDWERTQPGCGCTAGGKFWDTHGATVSDNYVHDNRGVGLWADTDNVGFEFRGNYFAGNDGEGLWYEISYNASIVANTFVRNGFVKGKDNAGFPTGAIYLSESGSDPRAGATFGATLEVARNVFVDNWGGVVAWEDADRFAGSPSNTSSGYGTLVNPAATVSRCGQAALVRAMPYLSDCRWKTQNVKVHDNSFSFAPSRIGAGCTPENTCGYNGLFSNEGTTPDWSPYRGAVVERNLTFAQNNTWSHNTYLGPWRFMVLEQGSTVSWATWRGAPYRQDAGSTLR